MRPHECFSALINSLVRSYRVELRSFAFSEPSEGIEVAITRNVVRSNKMASVALQACANVVRCLERTAAFGMIVCTMLDHACARQSRDAKWKWTKGGEEDGWRWRDKRR